MSIKVMTRVWQYSALKGTERLALLALAAPMMRANVSRAYRQSPRR